MERGREGWKERERAARGVRERMWEVKAAVSPTSAGNWVNTDCLFLPHFAHCCSDQCVCVNLEL